MPVASGASNTAAAIVTNATASTRYLPSRKSKTFCVLSMGFMIGAYATTLATVVLSILLTIFLNNDTPCSLVLRSYVYCLVIPRILSFVMSFASAKYRYKGRNAREAFVILLAVDVGSLWQGVTVLVAYQAQGMDLSTKSRPDIPYWTICYIYAALTGAVGSVHALGWRRGLDRVRPYARDTAKLRREDDTALPSYERECDLSRRADILTQKTGKSTDTTAHDISAEQEQISLLGCLNTRSSSPLSHGPSPSSFCPSSSVLSEKLPSYSTDEFSDSV